MIKDTVNNIHVSAEDVLITPEALSAELPASEKRLLPFQNLAKLFLTLFTVATIVCWWYVDHVLSMMLKQLKSTR